MLLVGRASYAYGARFDADPGPDRGGIWLGWPEGVSSSTNLIGSSQISVENGGGKRVSKR